MKNNCLMDGVIGLYEIGYFLDIQRLLKSFFL